MDGVALLISLVALAATVFFKVTDVRREDRRELAQAEKERADAGGKFLLVVRPDLEEHFSVRIEIENHGDEVAFDVKPWAYKYDGVIFGRKGFAVTASGAPELRPDSRAPQNVEIVFSRGYPAPGGSIRTEAKLQIEDTAALVSVLSSMDPDQKVAGQALHSFFQSLSGVVAWADVRNNTHQTGTRIHLGDPADWDFQLPSASTDQTDVPTD